MILNYSNVIFLQNTTSIHNAGKARNIGLSEIRGRYVLFADSDDEFKPGFKNVIEKILSEDEPVDLVYFLPDTSMIESRLDYRHEYRKMVQSYLNNQTSKNLWKIRLKFDVPWSKLISTQLILSEGIKFDETRKNNDTLFGQKVGVYSKKVKVTDREIYKVIDNKQSISYKVDEDHLIPYAQVMARSIQFKREQINKNILKQVEPELKGIPLKILITSFIKTKKIKLAYRQYSIFKEKNIPCFTIRAFFYLIKLLFIRI